MSPQKTLPESWPYCEAPSPKPSKAIVSLPGTHFYSYPLNKCELYYINHRHRHRNRHRHLGLSEHHFSSDFSF